jgi:hypothetical protein
MNREYEVWCDGMLVASVTGPATEALNEALHYASLYSEEGKCTIKGVSDEDWTGLLHRLNEPVENSG